MSEDKLYIESIFGQTYSASTDPNRATRSGEEFESFLPAPDWQMKVVRRGADVSLVVGEMEKLIKQTAYQTRELSKRLLRQDLYSTCKAIWEFLYHHHKYREDDEGEEQLRTPALSWYLRTIRGIDCDDFSIFAGTLLYNLQVPFYLRIAKYKKNHFQHVYVIVPEKNNKYLAIDAVLNRFDSEEVPTEYKDFLVMNTNNLNGIDVSVLSGFENEPNSELSNILNGVDFEHLERIEGLGQTPSDSEELGALYRHLSRTRDYVRRYPRDIQQIENPETFSGMLDYALKYWDTDKRDMALGILEAKEEELNTLEGTQDYLEGFEDAQIFYGIEGLSGVSGLGKVKAKRSFFKNVKAAAKRSTTKVKDRAKKVFKKVVNSNPVKATRRAGVILAMKTNLFKIAETLKWGYLTEDEARENGLEMNEWQIAKDKLNEAIAKFVALDGKPEALKRAILTGRAGGLSGVNEGSEDLGAVVAAATGTSIAAAMPIIKKLKDLANKVNLKKMVGNVKRRRLMKGKKKAEKNIHSAPKAKDAGEDTENEKDSPSQSSNSDLPNNSSDGGNDNSESESINNTSPKGGNSSKGSGTNNSEGGGSSEKENGEENKNLPANTSGKEMATTDDKKDEAKDDSKNPLMKALEWAKEHPLQSVLIAGGLVLAFSSTARKAIGLGGVKKRKRRSGNAKKNPPKKATTKKDKGKGGRKPPKVKL